VSHSREFLVVLQVETVTSVMAYTEEDARHKILRNAESTYGKRRKVTIQSVELMDYK